MQTQYVHSLQCYTTKRLHFRHALPQGTVHVLSVRRCRTVYGVAAFKLVAGDFRYLHTFPQHSLNRMNISQIHYKIFFVIFSVSFCNFLISSFDASISSLSAFTYNSHDHQHRPTALFPQQINKFSNSQLEIP
jgi:hypothetical protein